MEDVAPDESLNARISEWLNRPYEDFIAEAGSYIESLSPPDRQIFARAVSNTAASREGDKYDLLEHTEVMVSVTDDVLVNRGEVNLSWAFVFGITAERLRESAIDRFNAPLNKQPIEEILYRATAATVPRRLKRAKLLASATISTTNRQLQAVDNEPFSDDIGFDEIPKHLKRKGKILEEGFANVPEVAITVLEQMHAWQQQLPNPEGRGLYLALRAGATDATRKKASDSMLAVMQELEHAGLDIIVPTAQQWQIGKTFFETHMSDKVFEMMRRRSERDIDYRIYHDRRNTSVALDACLTWMARIGPRAAQIRADADLKL